MTVRAVVLVVFHEIPELGRRRTPLHSVELGRASLREGVSLMGQHDAVVAYGDPIFRDETFPVVTASVYWIATDIHDRGSVLTSARDVAVVLVEVYRAATGVSLGPINPVFLALVTLVFWRLRLSEVMRAEVGVSKRSTHVEAPVRRPCSSRLFAEEDLWRTVCKTLGAGLRRRPLCDGRVLKVGTPC